MKRFLTGLYNQQVLSPGKGKRQASNVTPQSAKRRPGCLVLGGGAVVLLLLCGGMAALFDNPSPTPTAAILPTWTSTPAQPTDTAVPTAAEPTATDLPAPTNTPEPSTPAPPVPTNTPEPPTPALPAPTTPPLAASAPIANDAANLRDGPGTDYTIAGGAAPGEALALVGQNGDGTWLQLANGLWIAAALVDGVPGGLPVVDVGERAAPVIEVASTSAPASVNVFTCIGGCTVAPDPSCAIKGNVNSEGELIYHVPGGSSYNQTNIRPEEGDRWFCTEEEARAAGFRAPKN